MSDQSRQADLDALIVSLPITIAQLDESLVNIDLQREYIQNDWFGVSASMSMMTTASDQWQIDKAAVLSVDFAASAFGNYGDINLTQWHIYDSTVEPRTPSNPAYIQFDSGDVTSGAPSAYFDTQQYNRQIDFPQGYNHIHQEIGLDGTYGLKKRKSNLKIAEDLTTVNRDKYARFLIAYDRNRRI